MRRIALVAAATMSLLFPARAPAMAWSASPDELLLQAARSGRLTAVRSALKLGGNPNAVDVDGLSPLELADMRDHPVDNLSSAPSVKAANERLDIIELLLDRGATIRPIEKMETARDQFGLVVVTDALAYSRYDVVGKLLKAGAPADAVNVFSVIRADPRTRKQSEQRAWFERTLADERLKQWLPQALTEAISSPDAGYFARRLLEIGADPNARVYHGHTPLTLAASQRKPEIIKLLLRHGADPAIPYLAPRTAYMTADMLMDGQTPLDIAVNKQDRRSADLLRRSRTGR
jgi:ankyrin repeat protein